MITATILAGYFLAILLVGLFAGRRGHEDADEYFLAGRRLPWYAVGLSMIGSNISTEHFIGMVGAAYIFGIAPANFELSAFFAMSLFIFLFLPYYFRQKLYTVPQFLEARFAGSTRTLFAVLTLVHMVLVLLSGALYAGGLLFERIVAGADAGASTGEATGTFMWGVVIVAATTGLYSVYGGLSSVVWTDVVQTVILLAAGIVVSVVAVSEAGGLSAIAEINAAADETRMRLLHPATDDFAPWPGVLALFMTLGVWYNCTNQFYIQRCFGARSEWDARMGVVLAGFIKQLLPLIIVLPGLAALAIYGSGVDRDLVFVTLLRDKLGAVPAAIVLAGMTAAIMSTVSSVLNSSATIFAVDLYKRLANPEATQDDLVRVGRYATLTVLVAGVICAPLILTVGEGLFVYIQDMAAYFAPSISAVFLGGVLWRGATTAGANAALVGGIGVGIALKLASPVLPEEAAAFLAPFLNRALVNWLISLTLLVVVSSLTATSPRETRNEGVWNPGLLALPESERPLNAGFANFWIWWVAVLALRFVTYGVFA